MKTFNTDRPILRYFLICFGAFVASITGTIAGLLLLEVIFK
jgi:hypothetical protein